MISRFLVFLAVVLAIVGGIHLYFWLRLVRDTRLEAPWRGVATGACVALALSMPLAFLTIRRLPPDASRAFALVGFGWMGVMFLLFLLLLAGDLVRLALAAWARVTGPGLPDPGRRLVVARAVSGTAAAGAALLAATAVTRGLRAPEVVEVPVPIRRLRRPLTLVQLTDLHVGPTIGRAFVEDVVRRTNALEPDLVAVTGDLVDGTVASLAPAIAPLGDLRARHGVYFVTGNHEYFSGADPWIAELERLGLRVLRNERVTVADGLLDVAGVDDYNARRLARAGHGADLQRALAGRDRARPVVLLAHQPREIANAARLGVDLQISGHTHAGQLWPFSYFVRLQQPYVAGLHRHGDTQIYVSAGTGYWGPPMRLGTRSEITRLRLRPA